MIGFLTIGQSPRPDMAEIWQGCPCRICEAGALDDVEIEEILLHSGGSWPDLLVTRLRDGRCVSLREQWLRPFLQRALKRLEEEGASAVFLLCTGEMPPLVSRCPLYSSRDLVRDYALIHCREGKTAVVVPAAAQIPRMKERWQGWGIPAEFFSCSPYASLECHRQTSLAIKEGGIKQVLLDCIGYSEAAAAVYEQVCGCPVFSGRRALREKLEQIMKEE